MLRGGHQRRIHTGWHETAIAHRPALALIIAALIVAGLVVSGYYLWSYLHSYESTSDAKVAGIITPISSEVAGKISKVSVRDGQRVTAGESLLEIDPHPYRLAVATAEAKYDAARAEAEMAARKYQDLTNAHPGALARLRAGKESQQDAEFEGRELLAIRLAAQHGAEAVLEEARLKLQYTKITAPSVKLRSAPARSSGSHSG